MLKCCFYKNICFICFFVFITISTAYGLEPATKEQIDKYKKDGTWQARLNKAYEIGNHKMDPDVAARLHYKLRQLKILSQGDTELDAMEQMAPPPSWQGMPTTGNVNMFVLLIEFSDMPHLSPVDDQANIVPEIFGAEGAGGGYPYESLAAYYQRASYGLLNLQGAVIGWYNTGQPRSAVEETSTGRHNLIKEALSSFDASHDFSVYDNDGDGDIDYFAVVWTGPHGAWASFWWGYQTSFYDASYTLDGKSLRKYSWQWESYSYPSGSFSPKVLIHETGHALGLPDYYDYNGSVGPDGGVGNLDMMDANWGDHNCFSKFVLDWLTPAVISCKGTVPSISLRSSASYGDALLIMPDASGSAFEEFFMVQNRYKERNDTSYPTNGLLIWHVDATLSASGWNYLYNNSYTDHKLLRLMEADGLEEIETYNRSADTDDYYKQGASFKNNTRPNSRSYNGHPTGIRIFNISPSGETMTFDAGIYGTGIQSIIIPLLLN